MGAPASIKALNSKRFMLKHVLDKHEEEKSNDNRFGIKVLKYTKTSFERHILESFLIQDNMIHDPGCKGGEKKGGDIRRKIINMRKKRNRERGRGENGRENPPNKRRKIDMVV